jgi:hypothetical protein
MTRFVAPSSKYKLTFCFHFFFTHNVTTTLITMIASPKKADWGSYFSIRLEMKHAVTKLRVDDGKAFVAPC